MPATQLEHYLVVSEQLEATKDFYCAVLGLAVGDRPDLGFDGYWLYTGTVPCIHLADRASYAHYKAIWSMAPVSAVCFGTGVPTRAL